MPRGGELSSFKFPGVGNLLKKYKSRGYCPGGVLTAGIDPCLIKRVSMLLKNHLNCAFKKCMLVPNNVLLLMDVNECMSYECSLGLLLSKLHIDTHVTAEPMYTSTRSHPSARKTTLKSK
jgi:hypothetical protein